MAIAPSPAVPSEAPGSKSAPDGMQRSEGFGLMSSVVAVNRVLTGLGYPLIFCIQVVNYWPPSAANARLFWQVMIALWVPTSAVFYHATLIAGSVAAGWSLTSRVLLHFFWLWSVDLPFFWMIVAGLLLERAFNLPRKGRRLIGTDTPKWIGNRIVILGNGPSLAQGEPLGHLIDKMDEVVRFNNFQTKTSGFEAWTGAKTTVHFSDSMLYPTFPEYYVPGASVVLSLFMDRLMVSGSYFIFRMAVDLAIGKTWGLMSDPSLGWVSHEEISELKDLLGIDSWRHPTSGCLAIHWFVRHRPDPSVPIYIHGFDFFEGEQLHYYDGTEPLYERINDRIGVKVMHQPHKEKAFVERMVREGKVRWLRDCAHDGPADAAAGGSRS